MRRLRGAGAKPARMLRGFGLGVVVALAGLVLVCYVGIEAGMLPANADARPPALERWAARTSLHATLRREASRAPNPVPATAANEIAGVKLYASNCAVCHGAAHTRPNNIARGLYQFPPQLARYGVEDDPAGIVYWKITHGIRFTGMPSFVRTLTDRQRWQLTLFLQQMKTLTPAAQRAWLAVSP